jgi:hypothetical protein
MGFAVRMPCLEILTLTSATAHPYPDQLSSRGVRSTAPT